LAILVLVQQMLQNLPVLLTDLPVYYLVCQYFLVSTTQVRQTGLLPASSFNASLHSLINSEVNLGLCRALIADKLSEHIYIYIYPKQLCYRRSYSEGILCNLHASQLPGRLFTESTRLWVYHGERMSRPKKCHRNLPNEVSLKLTVWNVPLAPVLVQKETSAAAHSVNARQAVSATNAKTLMTLFWQSRCGSYTHWQSEKWC